jgi:hypothetical protein
MTDLNTLIPPNSPLYLTYGGGINDKGKIAGSAYEQTTGTSPAFLAFPCDERNAGEGQPSVVKRRLRSLTHLSQFTKSGHSAF